MEVSLKVMQKKLKKKYVKPDDVTKNDKSDMTAMMKGIKDFLQKK